MLRQVSVFAAVLFLWSGQFAAGQDFKAGFSKVDITPAEPVRLSGYASRDKPMDGVDVPLFVRGVAIQHGDGPPHLLLGVESIGFSGPFSKAVFEAMPEPVRSDRALFVMSSTHSHTAPHVATALSNLFFTPQRPDEVAATERYTALLQAKCIEAGKAALADLKPAKLTVSEGTVGFAKNRRRIQSGVWQGFDEVPGGPVDHAVPLIRITDPATGKSRGLVFNYACHCTTFGGTYNRLNGDWAGYAMANLEAAEPGIVAVCTIGCGADANPMREGPMQFEISNQQGKALSEEVARLAKEEGRAITAAPKATFGYAGLPIDRPTIPELEKKLKDANHAIRSHAEYLIATHQRMGRLPETYPMPIQAWRFGDQFTMVFLGGEVVVDYALRIKQELGAPTKFQRADLKAPAEPLPKTQAPIWITAYANDVFGYVASERVRSEGGYEVDTSMIYYLQPGRWSTGTEEVVMRRLHELLRNSTSDRALSLDEALKTFTIPDAMELSVVAAEPLISDPVNMAVAPDGRLWVVQMGDYPRGLDEKGRPGGKVVVLTDTDKDGRYDASMVFLEGLPYPTGVFPYRDGAFVSAAPEIFFAKDTDGDGRADTHDVWFSGFKLANPQHRINGFTYGLDGWLYCASGDFSEDVVCHKTGEKMNMSGRDMRFHPDTGKMETVSGRSQFGRTQNDYGEWFGNNNSLPLFHFPMDDQDLLRNPFVPSPPPSVLLIPAAAAVYPTSRTVDRFNDLDRANRVTSGCGPTIVRDIRFGEALDGDGLFCEPVHNLVCRVALEPMGATFKGGRDESESQSEFFSSRDNWFRPVKVINAPDGSLWVADMYRHVIEHPQWIPEAWQSQLDVRAGADKGRIYRLSSRSHPVRPISDLTTLPTRELVELLRDPSGARRDLVQQHLVERNDQAALPGLDAILESNASAPVLIQTMATRKLLAPNADAPLARLLAHAEPRVRRVCVDLVGRQDPTDAALKSSLLKLAQDPDLRVRLQLAVVLGEWKSMEAADTLAALALADLEDDWMRAAVLSSARDKADRVLSILMKSAADRVTKTTLATHLTSTVLGADPYTGTNKIFSLVGSDSGSTVEGWRLQLLAACLNALSRQSKSIEDARPEDMAIVMPLLDSARQLATDDGAPPERRVLAIPLLARRRESRDAELKTLAGLISARQPVAIQQAAVAAITTSRAKNVPALLLGTWKSQEPALHQEVLTALVSRREWTPGVVDALEAGDIRVSELTAAIQSRLLQHPDESIRNRAAVLMKPPAARQAVLQEYSGVASLKGDSKHGTEVFTKTCSACHRMHERGNDIGAKLASLTNKSTDFLLTAILDPNQAVEGNYVSYVAAMKDGRTFSGMIVEQTATSISLARPDGKRETLLRIDIDELASTGKSFMPEGLEKDLTPQDVADVIAFLQAPSVP
jgi:putative membrane-bound dehydrogenase-like protein